MRSRLCPRAIRNLALTTLVLVGLAGCGTGIANLERGRRDNLHFTGPHPEDFSVHGIDVSKFQGEIDWSAVKAAGVRFAWIKATEGGDHLDEKFAAELAGGEGRRRSTRRLSFRLLVPAAARRGDRLRSSRTSRSSPTPCRRCSMSRRRRRRGPANGICGATRFARHAHHARRDGAAYGKRPVIYTTVDFYQAILQPNEFSDYPIWVRSTKVPPQGAYGARRWAFWQYQSDARIPGIRGKVDRNAFAGDPLQWQAFLDGKYSAHRDL